MELLQSGWWDVNAQPKLDWWAQGIAIAYEQSVGLRIVGQQSDGMFAATVSKTLAAQTDHVYKAWCTYESAKDHGPARLSQTPKRLYWRADMHDGSKIEAAFESKGDTKTLMTISQTKITDQSLVSSQKAHWTRVMEHFLQEFVKSQ